MSAPLVAAAGMTFSGSLEDYPDGLIIPVDKPWRWTSADVVRKVKFAAAKHFSYKKIKVGHAGTLDPLATGVLLVCIGKATKLAEDLQKHEKEYVATVVFGATTPSYDREKEPDRFFPVDGISAASVEQALQGLTGTYEQVAPLFSAKSADGVRAYEIARRLYKSGGGGLDETALSLLTRNTVTVSEASLLQFGVLGQEISPRSALGRNDEALSSASSAPASVPCRHGRHDRPSDVSCDPSVISGEVPTVISSEVEKSKTASSRINVADVSGLELPAAVVRIRCSKGTYIRAFARDLGEALGSGAFLADLRRTASGAFTSPVPFPDVLAML